MTGTDHRAPNWTTRAPEWRTGSPERQESCNSQSCLVVRWNGALDSQNRSDLIQ